MLFVRAVVAKRSAERRTTTQDQPKRAVAEPNVMPPRPVTPQERVARLSALKARLLAEHEAKHQALVAGGSILVLPSVQWLGNQTVICAHGHRASCRAFANMTSVRQDTHLSRDEGPFIEQGFQRCPTCHTDLYTFESNLFSDYIVCVVFDKSNGNTSYHLYRRELGDCPTYRIRDECWAALRSLT